ncbi:DUF3027 domain-containing protein [Williamsia sterculiae]|uniref:DUF3027 domain-containing protein n=1 Tax=Williamsia sterculiae TaxID=1344003 RepID=UPI001F1E0E4E|nr:DUF3027 domain-containing protein [Williamsia sterculiae]
MNAALDVATTDGVGNPDDRLLAAVDLARAAIESTEDGAVGAHLAAEAAGDCAVTHYFEADVPGYRGWQWCAVVAGSPGGDEVTVSEVALLPGAGALTAPEWVPWNQRLQPGDLNPGDVLAAPEDDPRLVPNQIDNVDRTPVDDPQIGEVSMELGLGRTRLLSPFGRDLAAARWSADRGPESDMARATKFCCSTCGFYIPVTGALRAAFGVCANAMAEDGRVVAAGYGCGAHSDATQPAGEGSPAYPAYDDGAVEIVGDDKSA